MMEAADEGARPISASAVLASAVPQIGAGTVARP